MSRLTSSQIQQIQSALLDAYTDHATLKMMVRMEMNCNLNEIAGGSNLTQVVFDLITWAENHGCVASLIEGACRGNPENPDLQSLAEAAKTWTIATTSAQPDDPVIDEQVHFPNAVHGPIINRTEAIRLFRTLLDSAHPERYLRLLGGPKMGKSHLLTKVFPRIARDLGAECVVIDLRNKEFTLVDHLRHITDMLGRDRFEQFSVAYEAWRNRPTIEGADLQTILANSAARGRDENEAESLIAPLTRSMVEDLHESEGRSIVLIFDAVEQADAGTRAWLMDDLLLRLSPVATVSIVVAGRTVPEPSAAYTAICHHVELGPVEQVDEYVRYCRDIGADMADESIPDFARAVKYAPGLFAEIVSGLVPEGAGND